MIWIDTYILNQGYRTYDSLNSWGQYFFNRKYINTQGYRRIVLNSFSVFNTRYKNFSMCKGLKFELRIQTLDIGPAYGVG